MTPVTGAMVLAAGTRVLKSAGIDGAGRDARRLLAHALGIAPGRLTLVLPETVSPELAERFDALITARAVHVPVSHLVGMRAFYGRDFVVTPDVLDPRPETETLIEAALSLPFERVLDLGTGSGCILLTLLAETEGSWGVGSDLSPEALLVAAQNQVRLGLEARADLIQSDWFADVAGHFDLIVSNPPYIALSEMSELAPEVRDHEPRLALTDEGDGLAAYRAICDGALRCLDPGGHLMVEIGPTQAFAVVELMTAAGLDDTRVIADLDGRDRVVIGKRPRR